MARPREFDPDKALEGATDIFWRQGYKATNLPELLEAMGLSRGSFYKAYRDKETVYLKALDFYDAHVLDNAVSALTACNRETAVECLSRLFSAPSRDRRGCFICNAMVELAPDHPGVADRTRKMANRLKDAIEDVLKRHGRGGAGPEAERTADLILHLYFGYQAIGKAGGDDADWDQRLRDLLDR